MAYFAPYLDQSGLHLPTYQEIEDYLVQVARAVFGNNIYLENDSQDFQEIAARARLIYDAFQFAADAYNSHSPDSAVGVGLDGVMSINGIRRKASSVSFVPIVCSGAPFTEIRNGVARDESGIKWNLPEIVVLDEAGSASVTATCQTPGAISALPNTVKFIDTPTFGWSSVNNPGAATPGRAAERDSEAKIRRESSVASPSQALVDGILGAIKDLDNVANAQVYENDSNIAVTSINGISNPDGFPPHSITCVVEGGSEQQIANTIALRKTPGCYLNGDIEVSVIDQASVTMPVRFFRPDDVVIDYVLVIQPLAGYTSVIGNAAIKAIKDYTDSLEIGQPVIRSEAEKAALSVNTGQYPFFSLTSLTLAKHGGIQGSSNIALIFKEQAKSGSVSLTGV